MLDAEYMVSVATPKHKQSPEMCISTDVLLDMMQISEEPSRSIHQKIKRETANIFLKLLGICPNLATAILNMIKGAKVNRPTCVDNLLFTFFV